MSEPNKSRESDVLAAERQFFAALMAANPVALNRILADDFILIDVMGGSEVARPALLAVVGSGQLAFEAIEPVGDPRVRFYEATAVVTGRTQMRGRFGGAPFGAHSRYTHVYVEQQPGDWRLVAAQGTQIPPESEQSLELAQGIKANPGPPPSE